MKKLKELLPKQKINEGSISNYYSRSESSVKSAARKIDDFLKTLITDKRQLDKLTDLITDLADEYAEERIYNSDLEKLDEADTPSKSDMANFGKRKSQGLLPLWWPDYGDSVVDKTYYDMKSKGTFGTWWKLKDKYVDTKFSPNDAVFANAYKPGVLPKSMDDLDTNLPAPVEKFLDRLVNQIKGYNLSRKKETLVIAKIINAMGMDKSDIMRAISKIKRAGGL